MARLGLDHHSDDDHLLHVLQHHAISDGWSSGILMADLAVLYQARLTGRPAPPAPRTFTPQPSSREGMSSRRR